MKTHKSPTPAPTRNSSIELLKIAAIFLIVVFHCLMSLENENTGHPLDIQSVTTDPQTFLLQLCWNFAGFGNGVFIVSSCWFLVTDDRMNKRKIWNIMADVWIISVLFLTTAFIGLEDKLERNDILFSLFPTTFGINWFVTCYLIIYAAHPALNTVIRSLDRKGVLRTTLVLFILYSCFSMLLDSMFFTSALICWVMIYFVVAYVKLYIRRIADDTRVNLWGIALGIIVLCGYMLCVDIVGTHYGMSSRRPMLWTEFSNPFMIMLCLCAFNLARKIRFENRTVNYVSGLTLLIYVIHENIIVREYYRPKVWNCIYEHYGYGHVILWLFVFAAILFTAALTVGIAYRLTLQKQVIWCSNFLYDRLTALWQRIEARLLRLGQ